MQLYTGYVCAISNRGADRFTSFRVLITFEITGIDTSRCILTVLTEEFAASIAERIFETIARSLREREKRRDDARDEERKGLV